MNKTKTWTSYAERLDRVALYIHEHLDEEIDLQKLADVACLSAYHWHRIYHALHGETIAATVKRLRLHRAAGFLAQTTMPIATIASRSGYGSVQSFTRTFRSVFGLPPAQFRRQGSHVRFEPRHPESETLMYDVTVKTLPALHVAGVDHRGSYMEIGKAFDALYARLGASHLMRQGMRAVAIYYDDPSVLPAAELRSRACVVLDAPLPVEPPLQVAAIIGGPYAILRNKGPYADMHAAYRWLYGEWLVRSGREAADAPIFEEYLNNPRDTAPTELLTDIHLPLNATDPREAAP